MIRPASTPGGVRVRSKRRGYLVAAPSYLGQGDSTTALASASGEAPLRHLRRTEVLAEEAMLGG